MSCTWGKKNIMRNSQTISHLDNVYVIIIIGVTI